MPNNAVRAAAEGLPAAKITRRTVLGHIGAAAALVSVQERATASEIPGSAAGLIGKETQMNMLASHSQFAEARIMERPDQELLKMGAELRAARERHARCREEASRLRKVWLRRMKKAGIDPTGHYDPKETEISVACGHHEASAAWNRAVEDMLAITQKIAPMQPETLEGLAVKARSAYVFAFNDDNEDSGYEICPEREFRTVVELIEQVAATHG